MIGLGTLWCSLQDGKTIRFFDDQFWYDVPMPAAGDFPRGFCR